jgi:murein DD-endopeptidase MepM/ murein hydrolase activator NlpD
VSGAFDSLTNTVYVSQQFLLQNANSPQAIAGVLLEEIGHSIDSRVNAVDAPGDEGQIFAAFVQGNNLSQADVVALQSENDRAALTLNGQPISVELSSFDYANKWATDTWDWSSGSSQYLGAYDYGSNTRNDGKKGFIADWGSGSPANSVPNDYFLLGLWTQADFQAGKTYEFSVRADDGFLVAALPVNGNNWSLVTPWEEWQQAYGSHQKYQWTPNSSGKYWILSYFYEAGGNAYLDLSWNESNGKNYYPQLSSLSDDQWDQQTSDNTGFDGGWPDYYYDSALTSNEVEQIYTDLSQELFGTRYAMTAGYMDPGYYSGFGKWHAGIDLGAPTGTPVKAIAPGTVQWVDNGFMGITSQTGQHQWVYGHINLNAFSPGQKINKGDFLGTINADNHLHFETRTPDGFGGTGGAHPDKNFIQRATRSPLQTYWMSKN